MEFDFVSHPVLQDFGYDDPWARHFVQASAQATGASSYPAHGSSIQPARVLFHASENYRVITAAGEREARPAGRLRREGELPVVGDWVVAEGPAEPGAGPLLLTTVLPRSTRLSRKVPGAQTVEQVVAANVDTVFVVMGLDGDFNLRRLERFAVMVWESGAQPVAVLTKADLHDDAAGARLDAQAAVPGVPVFPVSSLHGEGLEPLRAFLEPRRTVALVGSSGAGKSTLLNRLFGDEVMRTAAVRAGDDRGRHTTTHRQLVQLPGGGLLIDNPGVREVQLWADDEALAETFSDLEELARGCRFRDCRHGEEPGCEVQAAVADGRLAEERLASWRKLEKELAHLERQQDIAASRREDRRLGRFYKRVQAVKKARRGGP
ncbi:MAG: ribosome small subunit-dependent GTPase A [Acidobacteriota bacterium]|nr:ribosome small subunit-dependent GTPase A [Acidobacteriota bacterium]